METKTTTKEINSITPQQAAVRLISYLVENKSTCFIAELETPWGNMKLECNLTLENDEVESVDKQDEANPS